MVFGAVFALCDNPFIWIGETELAFTENVEERYKAYGWHTLRVTAGVLCDGV